MVSLPGQTDITLMHLPKMGVLEIYRKYLTVFVSPNFKKVFQANGP